MTTTETAQMFTPWSTGADEDAHMIYDRDLNTVASTLSDEGDGVRKEAIAEFIVTAANAHADILALRAFLAFYRRYRDREIQLSELDRADDRLRESGI